VTEQFGYRVRKDGRVFVTFHGRHVVTVAKATGDFKRGNERRVNG
jgi:hypothetical protein